MPTHMRALFTIEELKTATLAEPFDFTKECPLLKILSAEGSLGGPGGETVKTELENMLFDLEKDPNQTAPYSDPDKEAELKGHIKTLMDEHDAPKELYKRMGMGVGVLNPRG